MYSDEFELSKDKPYVLIDRDKVARKLNADATLVSGRIYYVFEDESKYTVLSSEELIENLGDLIDLPGNTKRFRNQRVGC